MAAVVGMSPSVAHAAPEPKPAPAPTARADAGTTDPAKRTELLGANWQQSNDRLWTTSSDATGFHVLVADAKTGYSWRTAATLSVPGMDSDQWIGNACVTGSGKRAVVVYAPRTFANRDALRQRGGFTAVVDLDSGAVRNLPVQTSLAYYNPGCGNGETAALTQAGSADLGKTRLLTVEASTGEVSAPTEVPGQVTSAVPVADGFVGAGSGSVVHVGRDGSHHVLAPATGTPLRLAPDAAGGLVYSDIDKNTVRVHRIPNTTTTTEAPATLATGKAGQLSVTRAASGTVYLTGHADSMGTLPATVARLDAPVDAQVSTHGEAAVASTTKDEAPAGGSPVRIKAKSLKTGKDMGFAVAPLAASTAASSPVDDGAYCSVPRNDPYTQVYQPTPRQVEWAADMAVKGHLEITRPAGWRNNGIGSYSPQQMFPSITLKNAAAGSAVPVQLLLGVLGQESNLWQAARGAMPGETGNPLIGNYYGMKVDSQGNPNWTISWTDADCGYGVSQMTDGMRDAQHPKSGETIKPREQQRAIATDYAANLAAGLQLLQTKWNELQDLGMTVNNNDPNKLENWFMTVWAYNSGYHRPGDPNVQDPNGAYGLGWGNNPANPDYAGDRAPFGANPHDFAHPQDWPYPEKVLGFAANPPSGFDAPGHSVPFFNAAWWNTDSYRFGVKPPPNLFCTADNQCEPGAKYKPTAPGVDDVQAGPCAHKNSAGQYDLKCWWHKPVTWKSDCNVSCGNEAVRFDYPEYKAEASGGSSYPPDCGMAGLPAGALIVDDIANDVPAVRDPNCARQNNGSFGFTFGSIGRIDLHQLGSAYGGHFWYSHTNGDDDIGRRLGVVGTWTLGRTLNQWTRVLVHVPDHGAQTQQAHYTVSLGDGKTFDRYLNQGREQNSWISLGVYPVNGTPAVSLTNINPFEGRNVNDVAWDAVAFQPLAAKPKNIVAVLGDSFTSGEGAGSYYKETDNNHGTPDWAACRRSQNSWGRKLVPPDNGNQSLGAVSDAFGAQSELGFVACSGAQTWEVDGGSNKGFPPSWFDPGSYEKGEGQFREIRQADSGVLTPYTTLVTLSISGNDYGAFAGALTDCLSSLGSCGSTDWMTKYKGYIDQGQQNTARVLSYIAAKTSENGKPSQAQIVLVGYPPDEFQTDGLACDQNAGFTASNAKSMNTLAQYMVEQEKKTVAAAAQQGIRVAFGDAGTVFAGHGVCSGASSTWFNTSRIGPYGEGDFHAGDKWSICIWKDVCVSRESYHPNDAGTSGLARVVSDTLARVGYHGT